MKYSAVFFFKFGFFPFFKINIVTADWRGGKKTSNIIDFNREKSHVLNIAHRLGVNLVQLNNKWRITPPLAQFLTNSCG